MKKTALDQYNNDWYQPGRNALLRICWYYTNLIFFQSGWFPITFLKVKLLRLFGARVGEGVVIKPGVNIKYPWKLHIENHVWIGEHTWIDNLSNVYMGSHTCISQGAMLLTGSHHYKKTSFDLMIGDIVLEEGVWIGAQAVICPGVTCHSHSVLAVNSVAVSNLEAYTIYQGNPAVAKRKREIGEEQFSTKHA